MCLLPIAPILDNGHDDVFSCHERELLADAPCNDLGVHNETFSDVLKGCEDDVGSEEGLRKGNAPVCTRQNIYEISF